METKKVHTDRPIGLLVRMRALENVNAMLGDDYVCRNKVCTGNGLLGTQIIFVDLDVNGPGRQRS